jgi:hypothetical protein
MGTRQAGAGVQMTRQLVRNGPKTAEAVPIRPHRHSPQWSSAWHVDGIFKTERTKR